MERLEDYLTKEGWKRDKEKTKQDCHTLVNQIEPYIFTGEETVNSRRAGCIAFVGFAAYIANEYCQALHTIGRIDYPQFLVNWGSAITFSAGMTAFALMPLGDANKNLQRAAAIAPAILATLHEFFPIDPTCSVFDPMDIAFYFLSSIGAYNLCKNNLIERIKTSLQKINLLRKKSIGETPNEKVR